MKKAEGIGRRHQWKESERRAGRLHGEGGGERERGVQEGNQGTLVTPEIGRVGDTGVAPVARLVFWRRRTPEYQ